MPSSGYDRFGAIASGILAFGNAGLVAAGATSFLSPYFSLGVAQASEAAAGTQSAIATGRLSRFCIRHGNPVAGGDVTYVLLVNGVASAISITLNSNATFGSDIINTLSVTFGDRLSLRASHAVGVGTTIRPLWQMYLRAG